MSVSVSGTSALAVAPLNVLRAQRPFGSDTVPGRTSGVTVASQCTSPRSLKMRTGVAFGNRSRGARRRDESSARAMPGRSSPSVDEIVCSLAGEIRLSG